MPGPETLFEAIKQSGVEYSNHESDLYFPDTPQTRAILADFPLLRSTAQRFRNQINGQPWIDIPFAYLPWWERRAAQRTTP
jgi:hypothetical protein